MLAAASMRSHGSLFITVFSLFATGESVGRSFQVSRLIPRHPDAVPDHSNSPSNYADGVLFIPFQTLIESAFHDCQL